MLSLCTRLTTLYYLTIVDLVLYFCFVCYLTSLRKVMYSRLLGFLETFEIIYDNQFGFRKKRSAYMALMILMDKITQSLENG